MPQRPPTAITSAVVEQRDVPVYLDEIGRCVATEVVSIEPQASGRVVGIHFSDGSDVKKGDKLFTIDPQPYELALKKALSELNEFKAELSQAEANLAQERARIDRSVAGLKENEARLGLSRLEFDRAAELVKTDAMPRQDYDQKKMAVDVSEAQVRSSKADVTMSESQLKNSEAAIGVARARVATAEAEVDNAKLNLSYTNVLAPIDGRAGQRLVDIGNVVSATDRGSMLSLQRVDPIYADFTIPESELTRVREHMNAAQLKVEVRAADAPERVHTGVLSFLDSSVKTETGTVKLRATIPNKDRLLWPGQFVKVRLILSTIPGALLVPAQALQVGQAGSFVFIVKSDNTVDMRPVKLGQRHAELVAINDGVKAGERVVTTGQMMLFPGAQVMETPAATAAAAPKPDAEAAK
ncbi:MAG TPA: efflux RND transporter periplasmic adaptor subunit [Planctomycetota bacterium]|nr:efflux RND transporter periplasmic adaptor subunit [Planctomycetota bacterium]